MPVYTDPTIKIRLVLEMDKDKEQPPTFIYRALNGREWRQVAKMYDRCQAGDFGGMCEQLDAIYETVSIGLLDWENMNDPITGDPIPFNTSDIDLILNPLEASMDLMGKLISAVALNYEDKKKSESQVASETD